MRVLTHKTGRLAIAALVLVVGFTVLLITQGENIKQRLPSTDAFWPTQPSSQQQQQQQQEGDAAVDLTNISYNLQVPPTEGCEELVNDLQSRLIQAYQRILSGVRYANIWGYLETENKGDAAIWSAQQILLSMMGIETMEVCRKLGECDVPKYRRRLEEHRPNSAIIMAGGGNFNDYYWEDQPARMKMISEFSNVSVRAFPQSIHMTHEDRIERTKESFGQSEDLQLAARDQPSYDWLVKTFGDEAKFPHIDSVLVPDIAFMWGNRSDLRHNGDVTHDILILARKDMEIAEDADSKAIPFGEGELNLGGSVGNVTYRKVDWRFTTTPGINTRDEHEGRDLEARSAVDDAKQSEKGKNQRAWAKSMEGFRMLSSARFVITDRLHGHIMSTVIGVPHVLMDSKLGKNVNFHNTWTRDCACTRITTNITDAFDVARLYFESKQ